MNSFDYKQYVRDLSRVKTSGDVISLISKYGVTSFPRDEVVRITEQVEKSHGKSENLYTTPCDNCGKVLGEHQPRPDEGYRAYCPGGPGFTFFYSRTLDPSHVGRVPQA